MSPDHLVCLGDNKMYLCIHNVMFYSHVNVPIDLDKILYNKKFTYAYNKFGIYALIKGQ